MRIGRRRFIELSAAGAVSTALPTIAGAQASPRVMVTGDSVDPFYKEPFIEVNEERTSPEPHRYVRGGFKGTAAKFSFYFPAKARYQGRFFHNTYPLINDSDAGPSPIDFMINAGDIGFAFDSGAYFVQTNQGAGAITNNPDITISSSYRLNAAAAKYSRIVAAEVYGAIPRPYGYISGGSGGSYQVQGCAENTSGVWDGFLPFVLGTPYAMSHMSTVRAHAYRVLSKRNKFPEILDAMAPGGSGNPYATLNEEERSALREATLMGFPLGGWWQYQGTNVGGGAPAVDPTYTADFWSKPGYLGTDPKSSIAEARIQFETTIAKVTAGPPATVELAGMPGKDLAGAQLMIVSGGAMGRSLPLGRVNGNVISIGGGGGGGLAAAAQPGGGRGAAPGAAAAAAGGGRGAAGGGLPAGLQVGDKVRIDNSASLAYQTYHRHHLPPSAEYYAWNQFRNADGTPKYPQRTLQTPQGALNTIGSMPDGQIKGKVLVMEAMMDIHAWPWQADWYRTKIKQALGPRFDDNFAIWFVENAQHDVPGHFGTQGLEKQALARTISAVGILQQGLRDLSAWVEKGIKPAQTQYNMVDTQVQLPATARARRGIQPVVKLLANGAVRTQAAVGKPVKFAGTVEVPPNAGKVVAVEWDYEGIGEVQAKETLRTPQAMARVSGEHVYSKPGTYFAVLRVYSQRQGDAQTPYARIQNMGRVRVIVG